METLKIKYVNFSSMRRFGVEIEVGHEVKKKDVHLAIKSSSQHDVYTSRYGLSSNNRHWHVKDDATCGIKGRKGPKGVEIASFVGNGNQDIDHISQMAGNLSQIGCKTNDNCGLHIHAEAVDFTVEQCSILVAYWIKIEKILSMALPIRRNRSEYCKFTFPHDASFDFKLCRETKYSADLFWQIISPKNLGFFDNEDRRFNLNLVNFARSIRDQNLHRKTIELRWPEGSLDPIDIGCWTRLFLSFVENCKFMIMPNNLEDLSLQQTLCCVGLENLQSFTILSRNMHETKTWFLERIIKHESDSVEFYNDEKIRNTVIEAKEILNKMWSPLRKYA